MFNKNTNYNSEILLHQHEMLYGNYNLATNANSVLESSSIFINQDPFTVLNTCSKKQPVKKDRHSKIQTAQGPRDRRVRLSIGIARKFFDLQEMLGFDKPSKTLDWLLTKSKTAIKDLVQTKQNCQVKDLENGKNLKMKSGNKLKEAQDLQTNLAKESRAKARARARERTREKMCIKQINENQNTSTAGYDLNPSNVVVPIQYMNNQLEVCKISGCQPNYEAGIQESIFIKRKVMKNPSIFGFQQNLSPYTSAENWDFSSFTQSNMFINRSSNN